MRILVTGGAGFIGGHIVDAMLEDGHEVLVVDDLSTGRRENVPDSARFEECDLRDRARLHRVLADFRPELVSHQAAQTSVAVSTRDPVRDAEINVIGSLNLFDACVRHDTRVIFASTGGAIYGEVPEGQRASEEWTPTPISPYACSKLAVERYLFAYEHEHGLRYSVLRYANVYGPRQDPHGEAGVVAIFAQRLLESAPLQINAMKAKGDDGCVRDYIYVGDVVAANRAVLAQTLTAKVANVGTGIATTTKEVADGLRAHIESKSRIDFGDRRPGDLARSVLAPAAALGTPRTLHDGLAATAAWFAAR